MGSMVGNHAAVVVALTVDVAGVEDRMSVVWEKGVVSGD